ncbi:Crp/Fnr family transcriptional regulator [Solimonas terrae]|uniref:Crp/Fnr family transcriptional regulator n=1 Tax=Solimonas terrae TaxID=1396819 RepID=A0A6M2BPW5_9GAMM|nr:Crp/Fnr family transcriptional regulator [Solimonas terrae]NGY04652.1 Crp/Fnr family transcriptional regulator [Solimonas terrae]
MAIAENHLIALLPRRQRLRVLAICEPVRLSLQDVLCERGMAIRHVYFPVDSIVSLGKAVDGRATLELAMVGCEGMLGAELVLGVASAPLDARVLRAGAASRIHIPVFRRELASSAPLQRILKRYLYLSNAQLATSAVCVHFHLIQARLARWLLMIQDRAHAQRFHVTHELLARMLGVRRVGITVAAGALQHGRLISYRRGELTVLDRKGLEASACSCYASDRLAYGELMH